MRQDPFGIEKIRELLFEDKIEEAIDILLVNLKNVIHDAEEIINQGQSVMNSGLAFFMPPDLKMILDEFRNTVTILSASTARIETDFKNKLIEWPTRHAFRNKVIQSLNSILTDLENFNRQYGKLFSPTRQLLPSPGESSFLEIAQNYIHLMRSLSSKLEALINMDVDE